MTHQSEVPQALKGYGTLKTIHTRMMIISGSPISEQVTKGRCKQKQNPPDISGQTFTLFHRETQTLLGGGFGVCNFDDRVPTMRSSNLSRRRALPQMRVRGKVKCTRQTPTKGYRYHLHNVTATCLSLSYLVRRLQKGDIVAL